MIPVIVYPTHQAKRAHKLYEHCLDLDKTSIELIEQTPEDDARCEILYPKNRFHCLQSHALRRAAREIDTEFIWLETDSIPLKAGWVRTLTEAYWQAKEHGKKFLLSSDCQRFDEIGGIGVYPPETQFLVPTDFEKSGWDLWLIRVLPDFVERSPLIQHSYGWYDQNTGFVEKEHRFPRDQEMLRPEALIFHRDRHQDLISL